MCFHASLTHFYLDLFFIYYLFLTLETRLLHVNITYFEQFLKTFILRDYVNRIFILKEEIGLKELYVVEFSKIFFEDLDSFSVVHPLKEFKFSVIRYIFTTSGMIKKPCD